MTILDRASLAFDAYAPDSSIDFEDLEQCEQERWIAVAEALSSKPKRQPKISIEDAAKIRELAAKHSRAYLASKFGVSKTTIGAIVRMEIRV